MGLDFHPRIDLQDERQGDEDNEALVLSNATITVVVACGRAPLISSLSWLARRLTIVGVAAAATSLGFLGLAIRQSLHPLHRIAAEIAPIDVRKLDVRIATGRAPAEVLPIVERLNELLSRLEQAFRREKTFSSDVAHELRTPLAGLRSTIEVCLSRHRDGDEYRDALGACLEICQQSQNMIEMLLTLVRAESGRMEVRSERLNVREMLRQCWKSLVSQADARQLQQYWEISDRLTVNCDHDVLRIVIGNVLENAVIHSDHGGTIRVSALAHKAFCQLSLENTGNQLAPDEARHVFDRFWRASTSRSDTGNHFGLGLPLARRLTELMGGTMDAAADGTTFRMTLRLPSLPVASTSAP